MHQIIGKKISASPRPVLGLVRMRWERFWLRFGGVILKAAGDTCQGNSIQKWRERTWTSRCLHSSRNPPTWPHGSPSCVWKLLKTRSSCVWGSFCDSWNNTMGGNKRWITKHEDWVKMNYLHDLLLLQCPLVIPLDSSSFSFLLLLLGKPIEPFVSSFRPLPEGRPICLVSGWLVNSIKFVLEKSTGRSVSIPFPFVIPSFLWLSGCLTLFSRNLAAIPFDLQGLYGSFFLFMIWLRKTFDPFLSDCLEAE